MSELLSVHDCVHVSVGVDCAFASMLCVTVARVSVSGRVSRYLQERVCVALGHHPCLGTSSPSPVPASLPPTEYSLSLGTKRFTYVLSFMPHRRSFLTPTPCQALCIWGLRPGQAQIP